MLGRRRSRGAEMCLAALVSLALFWTQTEASALNNITKEEGKEVTVETEGFQPGIIVLEGNNASDTDYQSDWEGNDWTRDFYNLGPTVKCGANQMSFLAAGDGVKYFTLNPTPSGCGSSVSGLPHSLTLTVPYKGCNLGTEGGYYNYPLSWNNHKVKFLCPGAPPPPTDAPALPTWPFFPPWWQYPHYPPTSPPAMDLALPPWPQWPPHHHHPYPYFPPWLWYYYLHLNQPPPSAPPTDPPTQLPPWVWYPPQHKPPLDHPAPPTDPPYLPPWYGPYLPQYKYPPVPTAPPTDPPTHRPPWLLAYPTQDPYPPAHTAPTDPPPQLPHWPYGPIGPYHTYHKYPPQPWETKTPSPNP